MRSKFGNKKVTVGGETFDSHKEYNRWCQLKLMQRAGLIYGLERQVKYKLLPTVYETYERYSDKTGKRLKDGQKVIEHEVSYIADFVYKEMKSGKTIVEDVKGYKKGAAYDLFVLKRKMMLHFHGIRIHEI